MAETESNLQLSMAVNGARYLDLNRGHEGQVLLEIIEDNCCWSSFKNCLDVNLSKISFLAMKGKEQT